MTQKKLRKKISKNTKALLIPNLIGNIPDWQTIKKIAKKHNLKIIEDSADTLGAKIKNLQVFLAIYLLQVSMAHT